MGVLRPDVSLSNELCYNINWFKCIKKLIMRNVIPVIMAGIIAIYGLVVSVLISGDRKCF